MKLPNDKNQNKSQENNNLDIKTFKHQWKILQNGY